MATRSLSVFSLAALCLACTSNAYAAGLQETTDTFCNKIQLSIMGNTVSADTIVHPDWQAFLESKASVDPLRNEQFITTDPTGKPRMVSCKMKTPDHIREVYGEAASAEEAKSCEAINRENVAAVIAGLSSEEQDRRVFTDQQIVFEEDETEFMGVNWVKPFDYVSRGPDGELHIRSKRLQVDWTNILFKMAPEQFRGALYCHLIAPEYVKELILGEADITSTWENTGQQN